MNGFAVSAITTATGRLQGSEARTRLRNARVFRPQSPPALATPQATANESLSFCSKPFSLKSSCNGIGDINFHCTRTGAMTAANPHTENLFGSLLNFELGLEMS
jgi:hypothetical protein